MRADWRIAVAGIVAVGGLVAACGGSGSSGSAASSTSSSLVQAPPSVGPAPGGGQSGSDSAPALGPRETAYLNALKGQGITPGDNTAEVSLAKLICVSIKQHTPQNQLVAMANAIAGTDAQAAGKQVTDAQLDALGQIYINTAKSTYCQ